MTAISAGTGFSELLLQFMWSLTAAFKTGTSSCCLIIYCVILKKGLHTFDKDALTYLNRLMIIKY